jgi:5-methylcytosine-specific restriction endonuclease McrA
MSKVFCLDTNQRILTPIHSGKARQLLNNHQAAVFKTYPFTIVLKKPSKETTEPLQLKIDPGAKHTGIALVNNRNGDVVFAAEIEHRPTHGKTGISTAMKTRLGYRRGRRSRNLRYRAKRFNNRSRPDNWLQPSLESKVCNIITWVKRLQRIANVGGISIEIVNFDTQKMENPNIQGKEYQKGELFGYETKQFLLERAKYKCVYCDAVDVPLEIEHIIPRSKGGSDSIKNLTVACTKCNQKKSNQDIKEFLKKDQNRLKRILENVKITPREAAHVNQTKTELLRRLTLLGLPIETGSGGLTKFNRTQQGLEKTHFNDAACVGESTPRLQFKELKPLFIKATGQGKHVMRTSSEKESSGFPSINEQGQIIGHKKRVSNYFGFKTGDIVKAENTKGKNKGIYTGRICCRETGKFDLKVKEREKPVSVNYKKCKHIQKNDGYSYNFEPNKLYSSVENQVVNRPKLKEPLGNKETFSATQTIKENKLCQSIQLSLF